MYFSQITAWLTTQNEKPNIKIKEENLKYHLSSSEKTLASTKFHLSAIKHDFPATDIGNGLILSVSFLSSPRTACIPNIICGNCNINQMDNLLDDRMVTYCNLKGKHRCEDMEEDDDKVKMENNLNAIKRLCHNNKGCEASTSKSKPNLNVFIEKYYLNEKQTPDSMVQEKLKNGRLQQNANDLIKDKGQLLLEAIEKSGQMNTKESVRKDESKIPCDKRDSDIYRIKSNFNIYMDKHCDSSAPKTKQKQIRDISNWDLLPKRSHARQKITFEDFESMNCDKNSDVKSKDICGGQVIDVPSQVEQARFRKNLDNAASMVFHSRTGLPLTSSPAPVRRGKTCFDFDSSINSVSAIKRYVSKSIYKVFQMRGF